MVKIELNDPLHIRIDTENYQYLKEVKGYFSHHVEGYRFNPLFKSGQWDGRVSMFNGVNRTIPYGLVLELLKYHKREWTDTPFTLSNDVKFLFNGITPEYVPCLSWQPYEYQDDCIKACLKTSKGIIRSATASGKSLMISYVINALRQVGESEKGIIIVPSIGLVTQFYEDMKDYGMDTGIIGRVGDKWKEFDRPITISTWQSLNNNTELLSEYDTVIVDEVHGAKAKVLSEMLKHTKSARWRFGFTGTMPNSMLEQYQVMSYLGPVLKEYGSVELAKLGYVAHCKINLVNIDYNGSFRGEYNEVKDAVFNNNFRMGVIRNIVSKLEGNVLLLVGKVEDEGEVLKRVLRDAPELANHEIEFLSGKDGAEDRELWRRYMDNSKHVILIATYGIFQQGINIKSLRNLILASPYKSKIRVLQSIGRTLRLHADKKKGALVWDLCDNVKYLREHSDIRMKHYSMEGFDMVEHFIMEGQIYENTLFD